MSAKKIIYTKEAPEPIGPYSQAIFADPFLYISGQIAIEPATSIFLNENVEIQTLRVMKNLEAILKEAGLGFENVIKTSIFLKDMNDFPLVNGVYGKFFTENPPARETVEVSRLPKDAKVEISCVACK